MIVVKLDEAIYRRKHMDPDFNSYIAFAGFISKPLTALQNDKLGSFAYQMVEHSFVWADPAENMHEKHIKFVEHIYTRLHFISRVGFCI